MVPALARNSCHRAQKFAKHMAGWMATSTRSKSLGVFSERFAIKSSPSKLLCSLPEGLQRRRHQQIRHRYRVQMCLDGLKLLWRDRIVSFRQPVASHPQQVVLAPNDPAVSAARNNAITKLTVLPHPKALEQHQQPLPEGFDESVQISGRHDRNQNGEKRILLAGENEHLISTMTHHVQIPCHGKRAHGQIALLRRTRVVASESGGSPEEHGKV